MPRRALISDIHGNLVALQAVLADIKSQNVDEIACLGDICGYGPQPTECIRLVRQHAVWTLRGNHDDALFTDPYDFGRNALAAIRWQRELLQPGGNSPPEVIDDWNWLKNLPSQRQERDVLFVHGSPRDYTYEYVLREDFEDVGFGPTQKARDIFAAIEWICFCGHSHRPGVATDDFRWVVPSDINAGGYVLRRGAKAVINIGSVGQPRDGIPASCYCIYEFPAVSGTETTKLAANPVHRPQSSVTLVGVPDKPPAEVETRKPGDLTEARDTALRSLPRVNFRRVEYDIAEAQRRFKAVLELPEHNALRLAKGM
jgi:predicted phosphodiesterase